MDREDELKKIVADYDAREQKGAREAKKTEREAAVKSTTSSAARMVLYTAAVAAVIFLCARVMQGVGVFEKKSFWAAGKMLSTDYKIEECVGRMWDIRKSIDAYYSSHRRFPISMEELYKDRSGIKPYVCPASGKPYIMKAMPGKRIFMCPNPADHDVTEIWCDVTSGPPTIERY